MVGYREGEFRAAHLSVGLLQPRKSLRAGQIVDEMAVNMDQGLSAIQFVDNMIVPNFLKECASSQRCLPTVIFRRSICISQEVSYTCAQIFALHLR